MNFIKQNPPIITPFLPFVSYNHNQILIQTDAKKLKEILFDLIEKSRQLIKSLQKCVVRAEELEIQKNMWKNKYYNFKQLCENYITQSMIKSFEYEQPAKINSNNLVVPQTKKVEKSSPTYQQKLELYSPRFGASTSGKIKDSQQRRQGQKAYSIHRIGPKSSQKQKLISMNTTNNVSNVVLFKEGK